VEAIRTVIIIILEMEGIQEIKIATTTTITITIDKVDTRTKIIIITKSITEKKNRMQLPFRTISTLRRAMILKLKSIFQAEMHKEIEIKITTTITEKKETTIETTKITRITTTTIQIEKRVIITPVETTTTFLIKVESMMVLREVRSRTMATTQQKQSKY